MHSVALISSLFSLLALTNAQAGRFPCTTVIAGIPTLDQTLCATLTPTGLDQGVTPTDSKADGFTPDNSVCVPDTPGSGTFSCGFLGAPCNPQNSGGAISECDNGVCVVVDPLVSLIVGTCQGSFGQACGSTDAACLGYIYCTDSTFTTTASNTCGGIGSYCTEAALSGLADPVAQQAVFDGLCASDYCNTGLGECAVKFVAGQDCSTDPVFGCAAPLVCVTNPDTTQTCQIALVPSARARRNLLTRRSHACPASQTACSLSAGGFECVDTMTNLEQCGGCAGQGGIDCTALSGAEAVGCVAGVCERW